MLDTYIIIVLLTIVGTVTVIILFYFILMCISSIRSPPTLGSSASHNSRSTIRQRSLHERSQAAANGPRRQSSRRAADNVYMTHPGAEGEPDRMSRGMTTREIASRNGHTTLTIPSSLFLNSRSMPLGNGSSNQGQDVEVLRFYTAEELTNFDFEAHARHLTSSMSMDPTYESRQHRQAQIDNEPPETAIMAYPPVPIVRGQRQRSSSHSNHRQSVFVRHPELVMQPATNSAVAQHRTPRRCYSIPANYVGRPPAYLPTIDDQPPSYDDALRLGQAEEEKAEEKETSSTSIPAVE